MNNCIGSFKSDKFFIKNENRSGRTVTVPAPANLDAVHDMIYTNCRIVLNQISERLNVHDI